MERRDRCLTEMWKSLEKALVISCFIHGRVEKIVES